MSQAIDRHHSVGRVFNRCNCAGLVINSLELMYKGRQLISSTGRLDHFYIHCGTHHRFTRDYSDAGCGSEIEKGREMSSADVSAGIHVLIRDSYVAVRSGSSIDPYIPSIS
jgi:hypothetical protein